MTCTRNRLAVVVLASLLAPGALAQSGTGTYLIKLPDPAAAEFESRTQIADASKAALLEPTAITASGARRLDMKSAAVRRYRSYLSERRNETLSEVSKALGRPVQSLSHWDLVGNGMTLALTAEEAERVRALPGVKAVEIEQMERVMTGISTRYVGADSLWTGTVPGFTAGFRGEGVVVGVLDTGINSGHPAFADLSPDGYNHTNPRGVRYGLCAGNADARCNDKLIGNYDFVNETGATGTDAGKDLEGHGTHVSSTVAGNPLPVTLSGTGFQVQTSVTGVAPRANLISYKVCRARGDATGGCTTSAIISGLNQAIADGVDVINYSIGGNAGESPWNDSSTISQAFLNVRNAGIVAIAAAGNHSGTESAAVTRPAYAPWVMAVANTSSDALFRTVLGNINGTGVSSPFDLVGAALSGGAAEAEVVYAGDFGNALCGTGATQGTTPNGGSNPFAAGTFAGKIVICDRGTYARVEKGFNVKQAGAVGYVLANSSAEGGSLTADQHYLPTVHLSFSDGDRLKATVRTA